MKKDEERRNLEEFGRKMEQSFEEWYREHKDTITPPPLDLSFMEQNPEQLPTPAPRRPLWQTLRNMAAVFLVLVVLSAGVTSWVNSQTAHALKFRIEKLFHENGDHLYSTREDEGSEDNVVSMKVFEEEELETIRRQIPELRIPRELPEGYTFSCAEAECRNNGNWTVQLHYEHSGGTTIVLSEENTPELPAENLKPVREGTAEVHGRIYEVKTAQQNEILYLTDKLAVSITGTAEKETLLQIAEGLE